MSDTRLVIVGTGPQEKRYKTAKETDSIALEADALHLRTDVYTSAGVVGGLIIIWITGISIIDPIIAVLVAIMIIYEAYVQN